MPKAETCEPRLLALEHSDCHTLVVAITPPVPKPRMMRETMNCAKEKDVADSNDPMALKRQDHQIVQRLPYLSPRKVQARAPKVPMRVYKAMTVPDES